jgi:hypothetical protein
LFNFRKDLMRTLNDARADIFSARAIELGCGADYGLMPELLKRDVQAVGIDLDLSPLNPDLLTAEANLRIADLNPAAPNSNFSCYRFYPVEIKTQLEATRILHAQVIASGITSPVFEENLGIATSRADIVAIAKDLPLPRVERDSKVEANLVEGDAFEALTHGGDFAEVYASDFLHNMTLNNSLERWLECFKSSLRKNGKLILINDEEALRPLLPHLVQNGFKLSSADELPTDSGWLSLRIKGQNTNPASAYFGGKIMATFEKI